MTEKPTASRRDFLKLAGASAPAAVAAIAAPKAAQAAVEPEEKDGLRRTEHVERYLETARF